MANEIVANGFPSAISFVYAGSIYYSAVSMSGGRCEKLNLIYIKYKSAYFEVMAAPHNDFQLNTVMPIDGSYWIVKKKRSNSTKYWKNTMISDIQYRPEMVSETPYKILITEPLVMGTRNSFGYPELYVTETFLNVLRNRPKVVMHEHGNAYIFGDRADSYLYVGYHGNDVAQTGIILLDRDRDVWKFPFVDYRRVLEQVDRFSNCGSWGSRGVLRYVHDLGYNDVVFLGDTVGGDVGAEVYIHIDDDGEIDGLVIENNAVFPDAKYVKEYREQ